MEAFFEGPAGSGKTHRLIEEAKLLVARGVLGSDARLLALTFMNGARRRLTSKLAAASRLRRRFHCVTFDSFARSLVARRRSVLQQMPEIVGRAKSMNEFDASCFLAARLLEVPSVAAWIAAAFPLVIADEAQDLDEHRFRMLRGLDTKCHTLAAADHFQCLDSAKIKDIDKLIQWLRTARQPVELSNIVRTSQSGLLQVSSAIRNGQGFLQKLGSPTGAPIAAREAKGFRLREVPAANEGLVAWSIGFELNLMRGEATILVADGGHNLTRKALEKAHSTQFNLNKAKGTKFGPFPMAWEVGDAERASKIIKALQLDEIMPCRKATSALSALGSEPEAAETMKRVARLQRVEGRATITSSEIEDLVRKVTRDISRRIGPRSSTIRTMTIHSAKNQEFGNVLVIWPHTVPGEADQARRLLYNAITRARRHCSVIVVGLDRLKGIPFSL
jgi:hypothetical protein